MENKIINQASVEIEMHDGMHVIKSDLVEINPINIKVVKTANCDRVVVGGTIVYTIKIINECTSDVEDLLFKDVIDSCTEYVKDSFKVGDDYKTPDLDGDTLSYKIEKLESCDEVTIMFEVKVGEECGKCQPDPEKSAQPTVTRPITRFNTMITGGGVRGAMVTVTFDDDTERSTTVGLLRTWSVSSIGMLSSGDTIKIVQKEPGKKPSDPVYVTVV